MVSGENESGRTQEGGRRDQVSQAKKARTRRRRWLRRLLIVLALLLVLIWLAPYLLSTGPGTRLILSIANSRLQGEIQVEDLSLSWLGGLEVRGVRVLDPDGQEVLQVKAVRTARGLWYAIWSWEDFEQVRVEAPRAVLLVRREKEGSQLSLARAFSPVKPRRRKSRRPLPKLKGQIGVAAGSLRVVLADGRTLELPAFGGSFNLETLNRIAGELTVTVPGEGRLACKLDLRGLTDSGKVRFGTASGTVSVHSVGDVDLGPLAEFAGRKGVRGKLGFRKVQLALEPEKLLAELDVKLSGLAAPLARAQVRPIDLGLAGLVNVSGEQVSGKVDLTGPAGRLHTEAAFNLAQRGVKPDPAKLLSAVLTGEPAGLPEFTAKADGEVDLAALAQAVPALLKLRPDAEVTGGRLRVEKVSLAGGSAPSAAGKLELKDLTARRGQRTITFQPITAEFDAMVKAGEGLQIHRGTMQSEFARVDGAGAASSLQGRFSADLALLHRRLAEIFELGEFELGGQVTGRADLAQAGQDRVNLTVHAEAAGLQYKPARGELKVQKAVVDQTGYVTLIESQGRRRVGRVTLTQAGADLDGALVAAGAGWYDLKDRSFQGRLELKRADLAYLGRSAEAMGFKRLRRYGGAARLTATASRPAAEAAIESAGEATVQGLRVDGKPVGKTDIKLRWSQGRFDPATKFLAVKSAEVDSDLAALTAKEVLCRYGDPLAVDGQVNLEADLAGCAAAARPFLAGRKVPDLTGRLALWGTGQTRDNRIRFDGGGRIRQAGQGGKTFLAFTAKGSCDTAGEALSADLEVQPADLAYLAAHAKELGLEQLSRYAGTVTLKASVSRASALKSTGQATVRDLRVDGKPVGETDIKVRWSQGRFDPATKSLAVKSAEVDSDLAGLTAKEVLCRYEGPLAVDGHLEVDADLARCAAAARPFLKLDKASSLVGRALLAGDCRTRDGRISFNGGGKVRPPQPAGEEAVVFSGSGSYDPAAEAFEAEVRVARADLAHVAAQAEAWGLKRLAGYAGIASAEAKLSRKSAQAALVTGGSAAVRGFRVGGKSLSDKDITLRWSEAEIQPATKSFAAGSVVLQSDFAGLTAREVRCRFGQDIVADGRVDVTADLAGCLAAARPIAGWKETPALAGRFGWSGSARSAGQEITLTGKGGVDDFQAGSGPKAVHEKRVDLLLTARMDPRADTLVLEPLKIDSGLLAADVTGTVKSLRSERLLDLKGHYRASWERLSKVLHQLRPDLEGKFELAGVAESDFTAVGPARRPEVRPAFRGVRAGTGLGWTSGAAYGLKLGQGRLSPELAEGRLVLPAAAIPVAGGTLRLAGIVDFSPEPRLLQIKKLQALEKVPVNVELGRVLLSRFNPIFHKVARLTGKASLLLEGVELPLDESIKTGGAGSGRLKLDEVELLPTGVLSELLKVGGAEAGRMQRVQVSDLPFVIDRGRIRYDNFTLTFGEVFDLRFSGSVYFDDRLEMTVSVPVRAALLEKFGAKGPVRDYARLLEGARLDIPIRGTRQQPRLDWKGVNYLPLLRRAMQAYLTERAGELLKPERPRTQPATQPAAPPATQPATRPAKTPEQQIIDSIFDLLRGL